MKIGYLGPKGTFTETALNKYLERNRISASVYAAHSIFELFKGLNSHEYNEIIIPIENSVEGNVNASLDLMVQTSGMYFKEEIILLIKQALLAKEQFDLSEITDIVSHPQPFAQCQEFIKTYLPQANTHHVTSTALAAEMVAHDRFCVDEHAYSMGNSSSKVDAGIKMGEEKNPVNQKSSCISAESGSFHGSCPVTVAVIGNEALADIYNLKLLKKDIQDYLNNSTRFIVVANKQTKPTGKDKTSFVFSTRQDKPGGLYSILGEFAERQINLTRITSRPTKNGLGEYLFFLDCEGHAEEPAIASALNAVQKKASYFKLLGSYKKDEEA
ncbi:prephenate dehydratase [Thermoproteota archaeon]